MDRNIKSVHLVAEIIEDILLRLPVKSLLRFRCVSKSWLSLICSERFIETHLRNSTKNRAFSHHRVIFEPGRGRSVCVLNECSVYQLLNEPSSIKPFPINHPTNNHLFRGACVVGCCNGLICLRSPLEDFYLWNPAIMISMELPKLESDRRGDAKFGFGWDGTSGSYKVFALSSHRGISKGNVYSSKTNSWKTVEHECLGVYDMNGVFACGKIHWLMICEDYIEFLDLESEEFGRIELPFIPPPEYRHLHYTLAENGGCLHLLCVHDHGRDDDQQSYVVVWLMKESGWLKLVTLPIVFELRFCTMHPIFGGGPNGEILLIFLDNYLFYRPKDDVVLRTGESNISFHQGFVYVESLVSPNFSTTRLVLVFILILPLHWIDGE